MHIAEGDQVDFLERQLKPAQKYWILQVAKTFAKLVTYL